MASSSEEESESARVVVGTVQCLVVLDHVVILGVEPRVLQVVVQHRVVREDLRVELGWQLPGAAEDRLHVGACGLHGADLGQQRRVGVRHDPRATCLARARAHRAADQVSCPVPKAVIR